MTPEFLQNLPSSRVIATDAAACGAIASVFLENGEALLSAARRMDEEGYLLEDMSANDLREGLELLYRFCPMVGGGRVTLRLLAPHEAPCAPSIAAVYPGADWHERECHDFFGVVFAGHPNLQPLLLPEDFDAAPPLLKAESARRSQDETRSQAMREALSAESRDASQEDR